MIDITIAKIYNIFSYKHNFPEGSVYTLVIDIQGGRDAAIQLDCRKDELTAERLIKALIELAERIHDACDQDR